jgi:hypothetical protein
MIERAPLSVLSEIITEFHRFRTPVRPAEARTGTERVVDRLKVPNADPDRLRGRRFWRF